MFSECIRLMNASDLPAVMALQALCYRPDYLEPIGAFAAKLQGSPGSCWVMESTPLALPAEAGPMSPLWAYLVALPVDEHTFPALHATRWQAPPAPRWLYLHDMAVHPQARQRHLGPALLQQAQQTAQHRQLQLALIAVQGSLPYWQRQGFAPCEPDNPMLQAKVHSFGPDAQFMTRSA